MLYLDPDLVVNHSIRHLYDLPMGTELFAAERRKSGSRGISATQYVCGVGPYHFWRGKMPQHGSSSMRMREDSEAGGSGEA